MASPTANFAPVSHTLTFWWLFIHNTAAPTAYVIGNHAAKISVRDATPKYPPVAASAATTRKPDDAPNDDCATAIPIAITDAIERTTHMRNRKSASTLPRKWPATVQPTMPASVPINEPVIDGTDFVPMMRRTEAI